MMALIADFMLVWLPAPTLSFAAQQSAGTQSRLQRFMRSCPDNAFQARARDVGCAGGVGPRAPYGRGG